ncbi:hypothetical protein J4Q44_G00140060 [Coregonus suidteri]|uniref:TAF1C beta-propeller domain-containing protein n=1 Tax=Coregonus suidteri TaxID=861788 RepID=A0AAN8M0N2_9TELE
MCSDHQCGVWRVRERTRSQTLEVIQNKLSATCLSAIPHVQGDFLVASESGAAYLWAVGKGLQKFRQEDKWCDPRLMVYADRTGVALTNIRTKDL